MSTSHLKAYALTGLVAVIAIAIVFRTPLIDYVTGTKKIAGVI